MLYRSFIAVLYSFALFFAALPVYAQSAGDLMVAPTRIVFEGRDRTKEVNLINVGNKETTYRISFKNMTMKEDGSYEDIEQPVSGELFADGLLRYSPRQVTLKPGEVQKVRVMLRKPRELPEGEYRSHLLFKGLPPESFGDDIEALEIKEGQLSVKLIPVFGVSIPVLVKNGSLESSAAIEDVKMHNVARSDGSEGKELEITVARSGESSVYGDVDVTYVPPGGAQGFVVAQVRGVSVLAPYAKRAVRIPVYMPENISLEDSGTLQVHYRKSAEEGAGTITRASFPVK